MSSKQKENDDDVEKTRQEIIQTLRRMAALISSADSEMRAFFQNEVRSLQKAYTSVSIGWAPDLVQTPNLPPRVKVEVQNCELKTGALLPPSLNVTMNSTTVLLSMRKELHAYLTKNAVRSTPYTSLRMTLRDRVLSQAKHDNLTISDLRVQWGSTIKVFCMDKDYVEPATALETSFLGRDQQTEALVAGLLFSVSLNASKHFPEAAQMALTVLQTLPSTDAHRTTLQQAIMDVAAKRGIEHVRRPLPQPDISVSASSPTTESKHGSNAQSKAASVVVHNKPACSKVDHQKNQQKQKNQKIGRGIFTGKNQDEFTILEFRLPGGFGLLSLPVLRCVLSYVHFRDIASMHGVCRATASPERLGCPWINALTVLDPETLRAMRPEERCEGDSAFRWILHTQHTAARLKIWTCTQCTRDNSQSAQKCIVCEAVRSVKRR